MVLRAIRVIRDTAAIPPQPAANASLVAKTRRCRSSRYGPSISNRCRIAASSITNLHTAQTTAVQTLDVENSDSVIVLRPLNVANPIPITTTDPDGDGTVSVTITDLTHPNAFSTDGVNFNGTASFGGITALQQTLNLDHSVTLTGDLSHLTITSTVASTDVLQVDAHNSEGGDIFGFIDWPVVSPDLGGPTAIGFSMNPQAGNSLASLGTFFQIGDPDLGDTFTY